MIYAGIAAALSYGAGRLYFATTGGFTESNIASDLPYDSRWEVKPQNQAAIRNAFNQPYHWLGKGCQSYVFESADSQYVIKFIKYQRFRPQSWVSLFTFIPAVEEYLQEKALDKKKRLDAVFYSWKLAYEELPQESGIVYLHLNKTTGGLPHLILYDKLGLAHQINLNQTEFMIQKKADMLCPTIEKWIAEKKEEEAKKAIDKLFAMILSEYHRGYADNDHALMQNTGISNGLPVHIDVGQFIKNRVMRDPQVYRQELYNKMYKFRYWLAERSPALAQHVELLLQQEIGEDYPKMKPYVHVGNVAKIPNEDAISSDGSESSKPLSRAREDGPLTCQMSQHR